MDRRFLSQRDVITASRNFVCVRMMTYESASEAQILKSLWRPGAELENTVFAILDPDGHPILRGGRGPEHIFVDDREMARTMNQIASYYKNQKNSSGTLPTVDSLRLALNVAACDRRPLAVVVADTEADRKQLARRLAEIAWQESNQGKLIYASARAEEMKAVSGAKITKGFVFVQANEFGTAGSTLSQTSEQSSQLELERCTKQAINMYNPSGLAHHEHVRLGRQMGIEWKSAIPVTDRHALQAQQRHPGGGQSGGGGFPEAPPPF